jgi:RimJ/RimL family protein N-acetyltransferase
VSGDAGDWSLVTERLVIRRFTTADVDAFHGYRNDPSVARWQGWSVPYPRETAEDLVTEMTTITLFGPGEWTQVAVARRDAPDGLIGDFGVRVQAGEPTAEIGVTFSPAVHGQGYATEALDALVEHLLVDLGMERAVAVTLEANTPTQRLLERAGFRAVARDGDELIFSRRA